MSQVPLEVPGETTAKVPRNFWAFLAAMGPGLFIMAFHLGPGEVASNSLIGARFGTELIWGVAIAVVMLWISTEFVGRYVAATGQTIFDGFRSVGTWASVAMFTGFIGIWGTFGSATSLGAGLAWQAMFPFPGVDFMFGCRIWGTIMLIVAALLVYFNVYTKLETIIKVLVVFMTISFVGTVLYVGWDWGGFFRAFIPPYLPKGSTWLVVTQISAIMGGVTSITYAFACEAKGWTKPEWIKTIRWDLAVAYFLLFLIDSCVLMAASRVLLPKGIIPNTGFDLAMTLEPLYGKAAVYVFCIGLWGAAMTTLFGAFLGAYGFIDFLKPSLYKEGERAFRQSGLFKWMMLLVFILCGMFVWIYLGPPIWMMTFLYITGGVWMPVMGVVMVALTSNKKIMGPYANGPVMKVLGGILILMALTAAITGILMVFGVNIGQG